ncbi:hypothetical protein AGMMS50239_05240 [Bacteroidia bacterium]|nr:hypothetical protein AGMMS50239_05240 [Bacteroidia bacterium]
MHKLNLLFLVFSLLAGISFTSCGGAKPVAKVEQEKEVIVPCDDQVSDKNFFRGQGIGQSKDLNTAREKARMNANQALATGISVVTKRVSERYVNDAGQSPADYAETFETLSREVVQQELSNVRVSCSKTMKTADGMYKVYMAVEAAKTEVFDAIDRKAQVNRKVETIYEREKFRKIFDSEMDKISK